MTFKDQKISLVLGVGDMFSLDIFLKDGWKLYDFKAEDIFVNYDVIFNERVYPFETQAKGEDKFVQLG